jgi:hypothetical protein
MRKVWFRRQHSFCSVIETTGSLLTVCRELSKYNLDLVGVEGDGTERAGEYKFFYEKGNENHELDTVVCTQENYISS